MSNDLEALGHGTLNITRGQTPLDALPVCKAKATSTRMIRIFPRGLCAYTGTGFSVPVAQCRLVLRE